MIRTVAMTEIHLRFPPIHPRAGSKLVTASADGSARVYNTITGACLAILTGHAGEISKIQFNPQVRTAPPRPPTGGYWVAVPRGPHPRRPNRQATPAPLLRGMSVSASKKIGNPRSIQRSERDNEDDVTEAVLECRGRAHSLAEGAACCGIRGRISCCVCGARRLRGGSWWPVRRARN